MLHTGQHWDREMSQVFFDDLGLAEPRYRLDLHTRDVDAMRAPIGEAVAREHPDWLLVYGDTNSTRAGAEAAGKVPVAHVEAGLRSFDLSMPEEHNRIAVDRTAALLLCPDERSARQLESEGVRGRREVVGDVMADATRLFAPIARERSRVLDRLGLRPGEYVLATIHREGNVTTGDRLRAIAHGLASQARTIVTDSGGLQKEAYWYRVPCVTVRPSTEWVDTVAAGANVLVEPDEMAPAVTAARFPKDVPPLYGDGHASERVAAALYATPPS